MRNCRRQAGPDGDGRPQTGQHRDCGV